MASLLQVVQGANTVNLAGGGSGFYVEHDGWPGSVSPFTAGNPGPVREVIRLVAKDSSHNALAANLRNLEDNLHQVMERLADPVAPDLVWLYCRLENESNLRRALLTGVDMDIGTTMLSTPTKHGNLIPGISLGIARMPWESPGVDNLSTDWLEVPGDAGTVTGTISGSASGRIWRTQVVGNWAASPTELWWGFRTGRYGIASQFQHEWNCTSGTGYNGTSSSGGYMVWTPSDTDFLQRLIVKMSDVTSNYAEQRGRHAVLLEAMTTDASSTFNVRLSDGFRQGNIWAGRDPVEVSATADKFYPLGTVTIPPRGIRDSGQTDAFLFDYALRIEARESTAGSGNLKMKRLILIPQSEGACYVNNTLVSSAFTLSVYTEPDGRTSALSVSSGSGTELAGDFHAVNYNLPTETFRVIVAGQASSVPAATSQVKFTFYYYPRYYTLRGSG